MLRGETKSGAVISGELILKWKLVWSQVAAGLRSPFRQKGPTSARTFHGQGFDVELNVGGLIGALVCGDELVQY